jgi:hypothetical protein
MNNLRHEGVCRLIHEITGRDVSWALCGDGDRFWCDMLNGITVIVHTSIARDWTVTLKLNGIESEHYTPSWARVAYLQMTKDLSALLRRNG